MHRYQQVVAQKPRIKALVNLPSHVQTEDVAAVICDSCLRPTSPDAIHNVTVKLVRRDVDTRTRHHRRQTSALYNRDVAYTSIDADSSLAIPTYTTKLPLLKLPSSPSSPPGRSLAPFDPASCVCLLPTVYIISFSTDLTPHTRALARLLAAHLPVRNAPIPHVCTVDATAMAVPPADMCAAYSGISRPLQECVMRDPRAREGVRRAVEELMLFMEQRRRISGTVEVAASVGCTAGTHRSVSIAEEIASGLLTQVRRLGWEEGIKVVVRHVHRIRGPKDRF